MRKAVAVEDGQINGQNAMLDSHRRIDRSLSVAYCREKAGEAGCMIASRGVRRGLGALMPHPHEPDEPPKCDLNFADKKLPTLCLVDQPSARPYEPPKQGSIPGQTQRERFVSPPSANTICGRNRRRGDNV